MAKERELLTVHSEGQDVYNLQARLQRMGYFSSEPTGYYGPITAQAVKNFQLDTGLRVDGVVGINTRNQLDNIEMMARVVHGEARGESYKGKVAVAAVILNRKQSAEFPNTVYRVIFQPNAFTAVNDGQYNLPPNREAYQAVIDAIKGWDPTGGSTYYYNPTIATNRWIFTRPVKDHIGNHTFAY